MGGGGWALIELVVGAGVILYNSTHLFSSL